MCLAGICALFTLSSHQPLLYRDAAACRKLPYTLALDSWLMFIDALQTAGTLLICLQVFQLQPASVEEGHSRCSFLRLWTILYVGIVLPLGLLVELTLLQAEKNRVRPDESVSRFRTRGCCRHLVRGISRAIHVLFVSLPLSMVFRTATVRCMFEAPVPRIFNSKLRDVLTSWVRSHPAPEITHQRMHACERALNRFLSDIVRDLFLHAPCTITMSRAEGEWVCNILHHARVAEKRYTDCAAHKQKGCQCYKDLSWWWWWSPSSSSSNVNGGVECAKRNFLRVFTLFLYLAHQLYWWYALVWIVSCVSYHLDPLRVDALLATFVLFLAGVVVMVYVIVLVAYRKDIRDWWDQQRLWSMFGSSTKSMLDQMELGRSSPTRYSYTLLDSEYNFVSNIFWKDRRLSQQPEIVLWYIQEHNLIDNVEQFYSQQLSLWFQQEIIPACLPILYPELRDLIGDYLLVSPEQKIGLLGAKSDFSSPAAQRTYDISEPSAVHI